MSTVSINRVLDESGDCYERGKLVIMDSASREIWSYHSNDCHVTNTRTGAVISKTQFIDAFPSVWDECKHCVNKEDEAFGSGQPPIRNPIPNLARINCCIQ